LGRKSAGIVSLFLGEMITFGAEKLKENKKKLKTILL